MRINSVFCSVCLCGRYFETESPEYVCPACHRHIAIEWGYDAEPNAESSATESTPDKEGAA
jgi:hypothetical protein